MDAQTAQFSQHPPRRATAAQGEEAATTLRTGTPYLGAQPIGGTLGRQFGRRKDMDAHAAKSSENGGLESIYLNPQRQTGR